GAKAMYEGEIGAAIVADLRAQGGMLRQEDFTTYEAGEPPPLACRYRGHRLLTMPGLTGGPTVARALELLEREDLGAHEQLSAESLHLIAAALRTAFGERLTSMADHPNTTHLNVVDRDRMCVSLTATLGGG